MFLYELLLNQQSLVWQITKICIFKHVEHICIFVLLPFG